MKANTTLAALKSLAFLLVVLFITVAAQSQAPIYRFRTPSHISGTAGQVNAVYRFPNVSTSGPNMDALVRIQSMSAGIVLQSIDRTVDGYSEAFQPEYRVTSGFNSHIEFLITFVAAGTSTPVAQPLVDVSALDIDGSTSGPFALKEFNRVDMGGGVCTFNTLGSQLTLSRIGTGYHGANFTGFLFGALVDTSAKEVMFSVSNANVSSFTYRVGSENLLPSSNTRYASLYFKQFNYPQGAVLSVANLAAFSGSATDDKAKLKWTLTNENNVSSIVLEKSNTGNSFTPVSEFQVNHHGSTQKEFAYTDNKSGEAVVYYRLKVTSGNGKVQYSNILHFRSQQSGVAPLAVYPSLVQAATTVSYTSSEKQNAVIVVTDMSGRTVKQQNVLLQQGTNSIQVSGFDQFRKGNYIVSVSAGQQKNAKQIVVQ